MTDRVERRGTQLWVRGKMIADCESVGIADLILVTLNYGKLPRDVARVFEVAHL